jgi:hypothetical protein
MLGMSLAGFTSLHVAISMIGIVAGFIVVGGMLGASRLPVMTAIFLAATVLTSITGFMFPITTFTPALAFGVVSSLLLIVALAAVYLFHLARIWRPIYVVTALFALYLNSFVAVVQTFQKASCWRRWRPRLRSQSRSLSCS